MILLNICNPILSVIYSGHIVTKGGNYEEILSKGGQLRRSTYHLFHRKQILLNDFDISESNLLSLFSG